MSRHWIVEKHAAPYPEDPPAEHVRSQSITDTFVPRWFWQRVRRLEIAVAIQGVVILALCAAVVFLHMT